MTSFKITNEGDRRHTAHEQNYFHQNDLISQGKCIIVTNMKY